MFIRVQNDTNELLCLTVDESLPRWIKPGNLGVEKIKIGLRLSIGHQPASNQGDEHKPENSIEFYSATFGHDGVLEDVTDGNPQVRHPFTVGYFAVSQSFGTKKTGVRGAFSSAANVVAGLNSTWLTGTVFVSSYNKGSTYINNFIDANIGALQDYIHLRAHSGKPVVVGPVPILDERVEVSCEYVGVTNAPRSRTWKLVLIINLPYLEASSHVDGNSFHLDLRGIKILTILQLDLETPSSASCSVVDLQVSLQENKTTAVSDGFASHFNKAGVLTWVNHLIRFFGTPQLRLTAPSNLARIFNKEVAPRIINDLNAFLKKKLTGPTKPAGGNQAQVPLPTSEKLLSVPPELSQEGYIYQPELWMTDPSIQKLRLCDLHLVGTHDSATNVLESVLSEIDYPDIKFLWGLSSQNAKASSTSPLDISQTFPWLSNKWEPSEKDPLCVGQELYNFVFSEVLPAVSQCQTQSISRQLSEGVRYFDLRVYWDTRTQNFHVQHGLRGQTLEQILSEVAHFVGLRAAGEAQKTGDFHTVVRELPTAREFIFINISHTKFARGEPQIGALVALIKRMIATKNIFWQPGDKFDLESLADWTLEKLTNGHSKVMFLNGDADEYTYGEVVTNAKGFPGAEFSEKNTISGLEEREGKYLKNHKETLWSIGWALTGDVWDIANTVLHRLQNDTHYLMLQEFAKVTNAAFSPFLAKFPGNWNLVMVDFFDNLDVREGVESMPIVQQVIAQNRKIAATQQQMAQP